jgi:hypothetical protein
MKHLLLLGLLIPLLAATPGHASAADADAPGRAAPVSPAKPGDYRLVWSDDFDGQQTVVTIGAAVGARSLATVVTKDKDGNLLARYQATAFLDGQGTIHVDGRGAPLAEPHQEGYSPDSFAIHGDGSIAILDDGETGGRAKLIPDDAKRDAAPEHPKVP